MVDLNALITILGDFLKRITAKRLAALALYLGYMAFIFWNVIGKAAVNTLDVIILEAIIFVVIPTLVTAFTIWVFTKVGGGDDLIPPSDKYPPTQDAPVAKVE